MNNARFWTGLVFLGSLPMGVLVGTFGGPAWQESALEGQVRYNGRPVAQGVVYFYSEDHGRCGDVMAPIDQNGRFHSPTYWHRDDGQGVRFRVHIYPDPRHPDRGTASARPSPAVQVSPAPPPSSPPERDAVRIARLMWAVGGTTGQVPSFGMAAGPVLAPPEGCSWETFEVTLAREPTRVDFDLRD